MNILKEIAHQKKNRERVKDRGEIYVQFKGGCFSLKRKGEELLKESDHSASDLNILVSKIADYYHPGDFEPYPIFTNDWYPDEIMGWKRVNVVIRVENENNMNIQHLHYAYKENVVKILYVKGLENGWFVIRPVVKGRLQHGKKAILYEGSSEEEVRDVLMSFIHKERLRTLL